MSTGSSGFSRRACCGRETARARDDELLGLQARETYGPGGRLTWASLHSERAQLMIALAEEPVRPREQGVFFYLYARDLAALRDRLVAAGAAPGQIVDGSPGPREELRLTDPDGYCLMVAQLEDGALRIEGRRRG